MSDEKSTDTASESVQPPKPVNKPVAYDRIAIRFKLLVDAYVEHALSRLLSTHQNRKIKVSQVKTDLRDAVCTTLGLQELAKNYNDKKKFPVNYEFPDHLKREKIVARRVLVQPQQNSEEPETLRTGKKPTHSSKDKPVNQELQPDWGVLMGMVGIEGIIRMVGRQRTQEILKELDNKNSPKRGR